MRATKKIEFYVDPTAENEIVHAVVEEICRRAVQEWEHKQVGLDISRLSGGVTNHVFMVRPTPHDPTAGEFRKAVVVRVYGSGTEKFIWTRPFACRMAALLSEERFCPALIGEFDNGVVEEFVEAGSVTMQDLLFNSKLLQNVASTMARLHSHRSPCMLPVMEPTGRQTGDFWVQIREWFVTAKGFSVHTTSSHALAEHAILCAKLFDGRVEELLFGEVKRRCERFRSPEVFCHNDIHPGNLLYDQDSDVLTLIDFEFAWTGSKAYDISNFFCEFAGFQCDYKQIPSIEFQKRFYHHYLGPGCTPEQVHMIEAEVDAWVPVTLAFWILWALMIFKHGSGAAEYLIFAQKRLDAFLKVTQGEPSLEVLREHPGETNAV